MFNNQAHRRNTYLHLYLKKNNYGLDPLEINQCVERGMKS